jgi:hypothetical protein
MSAEAPQTGDGRASPGALPGLTRRDFVARAGSVVAGATAMGLVGAPASMAQRFPGAGEFDAEVATAWFDLSLELVRTTAGFTPPVASRAFGYAGIALYEALVPGMEGFRSLAGVLAGLDPPPAAGRNHAYDWPSVANAALASILRSLFPTAPAAQLTAVDALEARFQEQFRPALPPGVFTRSNRRGEEVGSAIFEWSKGDGGHEGYLRNFPPYTPPLGPGFWVRTPPGLLPALQPFWGSNRCLALAGGGQCPPGDHPSYSEDPRSPFYAEALDVYETVGRITPAQREIALFWSDDPGSTATPPGHSVSITTQVLRRAAASLETAAEAYAKIGMAVCDGFVACWHQKYRHNLLRPVTYVRRLFDPTWLPVLVTPPFPEYPSGHSVQSGAAFQVLTDMFGQNYRFMDHTHDNRGLSPRSFDTFLEAAEEAAISRLYGGIHFRAAIDNGVVQGRCIGQAISALPMRV